MAEPPPTKRPRKEDGEETRERLIESLRDLAEGISKVVSETRAEYAEALRGAGVEKFIDAPSDSAGAAPKKRGVRNLWSQVALYVECLRVNGVDKYSELEGLWKRHYSRSEVRDAVEDVLEAERDHEDLLNEVESKFVEKQDNTVEALAVGASIPGALKVTDARSREVKEIRSYWEKSETTLFVMLRHFG